MASDILKQFGDRLKKLFGAFNGNNRLIAAAIMISAALVTGARTIAPFEIRNDQGSQLEAAERLVQGLGLTTNGVPGEIFNISLVPPSTYLTDWPPGFSLLVAVFLFVGIPLAAALKIIYATTTLIGWMGWAMIASHFVPRPPLSKKPYAWVQLLTAALVPILFTPWWGGTDIFLWAGIPIIFMCLSRFAGKQPSLLTIAFAGLFFGALFATRYTSLFLGLTAMLILFQVSYPQIKVFLKRAVVFLLPALAVIIPVTIYLLRNAHPRNKFADEASSVVHEPRTTLDTLRHTIRAMVVASNLVFGHPLLEQLIYSLKINWLTYSFGIIILIIILSWPFLLWKSGASNGLKAKDNAALSFSFLPLSLFVFLVVVGFATHPFYLEVRRYHEPLALCGILISYQIARSRATHRLIKVASQAIVLTFILYVCLFVPALASTPGKRESLAMYVLSYTPSRSLKHQSTSQDIDFPSLRLYSRKENSRAKVKELYRGNPDALFYVQGYGYFIYDGLEGGPIPGSNFRPMPESYFWKRAYSTKPVKIFWVVDHVTPLAFITESQKQLVFSDPVERMKIVVSDFPAGRLVPDSKIAERDIAPLRNSEYLQLEESPAAHKSDSVSQ